MKNKLLFVKTCYYIGVIADLLATLPLLFPEIAKLMFGMTDFKVTNEYLYCSRIGASLMMGWALLLFWASLRPIERRGVLLLTLFEVCGLSISSILAVTSGLIEINYMIPLLIFFSIMGPALIVAYSFAGKIELNEERTKWKL